MVEAGREQHASERQHRRDGWREDEREHDQQRADRPGEEPDQREEVDRAGRVVQRGGPRG